MLDNIIMFPFRLVWNIAIIIVIIALFALWWPFLFGSVIGVVLVLIFAPGLFVWPIVLAEFFTSLWER